MAGCNKQAGQAWVEALLVLAALASLWLGIAWVGRLQDVALQLSNASRHAAFAHAHQGLSAPKLEPWVDAVWHRARRTWSTRQGDPFLVDARPSSPLRLELSPKPWREPGVLQTDRLRDELALGDGRLWRADVQVTTRGTTGAGLELYDFDRWALSLRRHTAILRGAGAASDDAAVQRVLGGSATAWRDLAARTRAAGERAERALRDLDGAWGRGLPSWDWLSPWASSIPWNHLGRGLP